MKKIVTIALVSLVSNLLFSQETISDAKVVNASETLLKTQNDPRAWQTFQEIIRSETYAPEIRSRVMLLYAINNLLYMKTNLFATALQTLRTSYPKESSALAERLVPADWLAQCPECGGTGVKQAVVPTAQGTPVRCLNCVGVGNIFQLSPRVKEQFGAVLNEIKEIATENIQFAAASKKALADNNPQGCITALQELVSKYAHRKDLDEVKQMLAKLEAQVAKTEAAARQKEAESALRDQEEREYKAICSNLESLPSSGIEVMTREIDSFIEKYPMSANRLELELNKAKLERRKKVNTYVWTGFYISAGLAFVCFLISVIKGLFSLRRREPGPLVVPGLTEVSEESDPLAGTFTDSDEL